MASAHQQQHQQHQQGQQEQHQQQRKGHQGGDGNARPTLVIYGATGFTGAQVMQYLDGHAERAQFELVIAGRNGAKLDAVKRGLRFRRDRQGETAHDDETGQGETGHGETTQDETGQVETGHGETGQGETGQVETGHGETGQDNGHSQDTQGDQNTQGGDCRVVVLELSDQKQVEHLVSLGDVVVNLAGPYRWHHATTLIAACAASGTHYLDLSGEAAWFASQVVSQYDYLASKTGAVIVPSCGFDSVPADLVLYSALKALQRHGDNGVPTASNEETPNDTANAAEAQNEELQASITSHTAFYDCKGGLAGGTVQTMSSVAELPRQESMTGEWALVSPEGPTPPPRLSYTLTHPLLSPPTLHGAFFFMSPYNRCIVRRSWWLSRLACAQPQSQHHRLGSRSFVFGSGVDSHETYGDEEEPRHGAELVYDEALQVAGTFSAVGVTLAMVLFAGLFFGSKWTRRLLVAHLPKSGTGPSETTMREGHINITAVSQTSRPGTTVVTTYKGQSDPGYRHTSYLLSECALSLLLPPPKGTALPPLAKIGGVLTPSTAFGGVLLARLRASGKVVIESTVYDAHQ